jgi:DNA-binding PadR family transcriptional regulator
MSASSVQLRSGWSATVVESEGADEGPQKAYQITASGAAEPDEWLRSPPDLSAPPPQSSS